MSNPSANEPRLPRDLYNRRTDELGLAADEAIRLRGSYQVGLILLGVLGCVLLYQAFVTKRLPIWMPFLLVPIGAFVGSRMKRCQDKALRLLRLADYYDSGIARLDHKWDSLDEGQEFADPNHFYATDLDLFGRGSLFQLLCSARTQAGRETLASWMKESANMEEVGARQEAISELRGRQDLRETLAAAGSLEVSNCRPETFRAWVAAPSAPFPPWGPPLAALLAVVAILFPILYGVGLIGLHALVMRLGVVGFLEISVAAIFFRRVRSIDASVRPLSVELPIVREILGILEKENFSCEKLVALKSRTREAGMPMAKLRRITGLLKERDNPWTMYFSYPLMSGTQLTMAIDRWRGRYGTRMLEWLANVGELDALISLSAYAHEHPLDIFPELRNEGPTIEAEGIGHPLLHEDTCVRNDFQLGGDVRFVIISGSNMSGKSTFVRAIGLNTVLAWMGAPVRCMKLSLSKLAVGASVRVQDSIIDGRSHFLAEMQRLRRMIDVASETPLLYLTDEIMSGTNSQDRRIATEWVVRALVMRGAIGIITTHDLALTEIASNGLPGHNVHFEDTGESGNLTFDYRLRPGLLTHSNALNIAHMLGIDVAAGAAAEEDQSQRTPPQKPS
jgi:MutS domain V